MKRKFLITSITCFLIAGLAVRGFCSSETTNLGLTKPAKGDRNWGATINNNMDLLDQAYGNYVTTADDLPQVYIFSDTFNYTTGTTIPLPNEVDAVTEYSVSVIPTSRDGAIGDIYVTKTTTNFVVKCSENNTTDTFAAVVYYAGDVSNYGGSIYRRWYVSTDSSITDHGNSSTTGSLAWVQSEISGSPAIIEMPANKTYQLKRDLTLAGNISYRPQPGAIIDTDFSIRDSNYQWNLSGSGTGEYYLQASGGGNPNVNQPATIIEDDSRMTEGTVGSLAVGEWKWADNDTLGYNTVYVRITGSGDPDSEAADYLEAGYALTINGGFDANFSQAFAGDGVVSFGVGVIKEVVPQWWGANTTPGTTDMTAEIQMAVDSLDSTYGGIIAFLPPKYYISSAIQTSTHNLVFRGLTGVGFQEGDPSGVQILSDQAIDMIHFNESTLCRHGPIFERLSFYDSSAGHNQVVSAIRIDATNRAKIFDCHFHNIRNGKAIYGDGTISTLIDWDIDRIRAYDCKYSIYLYDASSVNITGGQIAGDNISGGCGVYLDGTQNVRVGNVAFDDLDTGVWIGKSAGDSGYNRVFNSHFEDVDVGIHLDNGWENVLAFNSWSGSGTTCIQLDEETDQHDNYIIWNDTGGGYTNQILNNTSSTKRFNIMNKRGLQQYTSTTLAVNDETPSVGSLYAKTVRTNNTEATTITDLDDGEDGQEIIILIRDANTTIDFTAAGLSGNEGASWSPSDGDFMRCINYKILGRWYCAITDCTP